MTFEADQIVARRKLKRQVSFWRGGAVVLAVIALVVLAQGGGWRANPDIVAREAARRPDTNYEESRVPPYTLPDLLADGSRAIARPAGWTPRRAAILDLFRDNVYGRSPAPPAEVRV